MLNSTILRTIDVFLEGAAKPLLVILGPTAAGKTSVSIEIAKHLSGEIVNADSRQLFRFLDIGTAKITPGEMHGVPHHLLSVKDPKEEVTVGWYQAEAFRVIEDVLKRGKVPLLVGGSMLYLASITDELILGPPPDPQIRERLEREYDEDGGCRLWKTLERIDPDSASSIHPKNKSAVVRAMEMYEILKRPKSEVMAETQHVMLSPSKHEQKKCSYDLLVLGITRSKAALEKRIAERVEEMLRAGWTSEVRDLLARGYEPSDPGMQSHGYREICRYLEELEESGDAEDPEEMLKKLKQRIVTKTRQYAKRQLTWWRNDGRIHWINMAE